MSNQIQQTVRLNAERNEYIKNKAEEIGCTYNSFVNILLDLGLRIYETKPEIMIDLKH